MAGIPIKTKIIIFFEALQVLSYLSCPISLEFNWSGNILNIF